MSSSNTDFDPTLGPWNILQYRSDTLLRLPTGEQNANGVVVAFDIYPYSGGTYPQTIFCFQNSGNIGVSFIIQITSTLHVIVGQFLPAMFNWDMVITEAKTLNNSKKIYSF